MYYRGLARSEQAKPDIVNAISNWIRNRGTMVFAGQENFHCDNSIVPISISSLIFLLLLEKAGMRRIYIQTYWDWYNSHLSITLTL